MDVDLYNKDLYTSTEQISHSPNSSWNPLTASLKNPLIPPLLNPLAPPLKYPLIPQMTLSGIICILNMYFLLKMILSFTKKIESSSNDRTDMVCNKNNVSIFSFLINLPRKPISLASNPGPLIHLMIFLITRDTCLSEGKH